VWNDGHDTRRIDVIVILHRVLTVSMRRSIVRAVASSYRRRKLMFLHFISFRVKL